MKINANGGGLHGFNACRPGITATGHRRWLNINPKETSMDCTNLKARFGDRFKVVYEESYFGEYSENAWIEDPWYMILLCVNGHICPWDAGRLAACTRGPGKIVQRLRALPFAEVTQDGDDGANVAFPLEHFEEMAEIMQPRKRRRLSEEQRRQSVERLRKYQFGAARQAAEADHLSVPEGTPV